MTAEILKEFSMWALFCSNKKRYPEFLEFDFLARGSRPGPRPGPEAAHRGAIRPLRKAKETIGKNSVLRHWGFHFPKPYETYCLLLNPSRFLKKVYQNHWKTIMFISILWHTIAMLETISFRCTNNFSAIAKMQWANPYKTWRLLRISCHFLKKIPEIIKAH